MNQEVLSKKEGVQKIIMVVDDEPDVRDTAKTILENEGYEVITAENGDDALRKIHDIKPDLVLLDIMMPGTPVKEVVPKMGSTKIVYLTILKEFYAKNEGYMKDKNVKGYIEKPYDINELVKRVKEVLG